MRRLTARLFLFFALAGSLAPLGLAAIAAPPHACCLRKGVHHCQDSASESGELAVRDTSCCNHVCFRATVSSQWAHPQSQAASLFLETINERIAGSQPNLPATASASFQSTRAPPAL